MRVGYGVIKVAAYGRDAAITTLFSRPVAPGVASPWPRQLRAVYRKSSSEIPGRNYINLCGTNIRPSLDHRYFPYFKSNHETSGIKLADFEQLLIGCAPAVQLRYGRSASKKTA
jgi:hypothetical protein